MHSENVAVAQDQALRLDAALGARKRPELNLDAEFNSHKKQVCDTPWRVTKLHGWDRRSLASVSYEIGLCLLHEMGSSVCTILIPLSSFQGYLKHTYNLLKEDTRKFSRPMPRIPWVLDAVFEMDAWWLGGSLSICDLM